MAATKSLRLGFAGTPNFASAHLEAILKDGTHQVVAAWTQPDRPSGRGKKTQASAVKQLAEQQGIPVLQPHKLLPADRDDMACFELDVLVVVAYGLILPESVLQTPAFGCINVHASLLPRWRGAAPIQRAIEAGDKETGVCIMQMDAGLDTGDVISRCSFAINTTDTAAAAAVSVVLMAKEQRLITSPVSKPASICIMHTPVSLSPASMAIEAGDKETGVCIMQMDAGLDTGDVISRCSFAINTTDTAAAAAVSVVLMAKEQRLITSPVSKPASICIMHTPVSLSPASMAR